MFDFWENTIFTGTYSGNLMESHKKLHNIFPFTEEYFRRWVAIFTASVDDLFEGEKALLAKQRP
jgi:hemoglobin